MAYTAASGSSGSEVVRESRRPEVEATTKCASPLPSRSSASTIPILFRARAASREREQVVTRDGMKWWCKVAWAYEWWPMSIRSMAGVRGLMM
jgi:hypothetical protein